MERDILKKALAISRKPSDEISMLGKLEEGTTSWRLQQESAVPATIEATLDLAGQRYR